MPATESAGAAQAAAQASDTLAAFSWGGYMQAVGLMFLLVFTLWAVLWLLRRCGLFLPRSLARTSDMLRVEAQLPLGPRKGLMVVRFQDKHVLLGLSGDQMVALSESYLRTEQKEEDFAALLHRTAGDGMPAAQTAAAQAASPQRPSPKVRAENVPPEETHVDNTRADNMPTDKEQAHHAAE